MRRLTPMMASAAAAALTTLAVTVAVPAIADDAPDARGDAEVAACLREHGLDGAPDGAALKPWLGERLERGDATAKRALHDCSPQARIAKPGPTEQQLRSCLKEHGVEVPGDDARALKRWLLNHGDEGAYRDAMKACDMPPLTKPGVGGACGEGSAVGAPVPAGRPDKIVAEPEAAN